MASPMFDIPEDEWPALHLAHVRDECHLGKLPEWSCSAVLHGRFVDCPMAGISSQCAIGQDEGAGRE